MPNYMFSTCHRVIETRKYTVRNVQLNAPLHSGCAHSQIILSFVSRQVSLQYCSSESTEQLQPECAQTSASLTELGSLSMFISHFLLNKLSYKRISESVHNKYTDYMQMSEKTG